MAVNTAGLAYDVITHLDVLYEQKRLSVQLSLYTLGRALGVGLELGAPSRIEFLGLLETLIENQRGCFPPRPLYLVVVIQEKLSEIHLPVSTG